ncbi:MAG: hypothetical protein JNM62_16225 [Flavobacteriales bacterium]|nr:hypothetical protein [Flavobacteriales bacterium]
MQQLARLLSVLFHPVFMPLFTLALAGTVSPALVYFVPPGSRLIMLGMVAIMTIAFPLTSALLLLRASVVTRLDMPTRQERIVPYAMTLIHFCLAYYLLRRSPVHPALLAVNYGILLATGFTFVITFFWKISAHMVGIGGLIGMLTALSAVQQAPLFPLIAAAIIVAGLLGSARALISDHSHAQLITGALLGWVCVHASVMLGWYP